MKINGSLVFDASSASEIQNLRVQKYTGAAVPAHTAADVGRAIYVTADGGAYSANTLYIGGASAWIAIATGGNVAALQSEVHALETSLGAIVGPDGFFVPGEVTILGVASIATDVTGLLQELSNAISGKDALSELVDVTLTALADNDLLQYNSTSSEWENKAIGTASGVQAYDAGLTSLAAVADAGIVVQTAENVFAARTLVAPAAGLAITDPAGLLGNPTFALANDLAALEGLTTSGYVVRTGDGSATTRSIAGGLGRITVLNGDGVASGTSVDLAEVAQAASGNFVKVTLDGYGRVTGNTAVVQADITTLVDSVYVNTTGDTMTGNLNMGGTFIVTGLASPTGDTDATNKAYVDALAAGLSWKDTVRAATTGNVDIATELEAADVVDGVTLVAGDRVLVKDQTAPAENGIYVVQATGAAVRATDMDAAAEFDGAAVFVQEGTANQGSGWTETAIVVTVGTDPVSFSQFTGSALYTWGTGLSNTGNTINVNLGAGISQLPTDEVGIDLRDSANSALILSTDGSTRSTDTAAALSLLLNAAGALAQDADGLRINAASVTNAMLTNSGLTINADTGTDTLSLGDTLQIVGVSTQGIVTSVAESPAGTSTFTVTASDATATQKGVASFAAANFSVAAGVVSLDSSLDDLSNVSTADAAATGSLLQKSAGDWIAVSPSTAVSSANLGDLADVGTATPTDGHALIGDGSVFNTQKIYHLHDEAVAATSWTVTHDLGQQYCNVTVIVADEVVIPQSITFDSTTVLTVTFNTAVAGKVVVMGVA